MAIGVDTSVVVRLLTGEPEPLARAAARRLERSVGAGESVVVTDLVAAETYHALRHHYGMPEGEARLLLRRFLEAGVVQPDPRRMLEAFGDGGGSGLLDRLVHIRYREAGATTLTFDRQQAQLEGAQLLEG